MSGLPDHDGSQRANLRALSDDEAARLEELEKKATPGPWTHTDEAEKQDVCLWGPDGAWLANVGNWARLHVIYDDNEAKPWHVAWHVETVETEHYGNAALISAMRNALPKLLAERKALRADLADARDGLTAAYLSGAAKAQDEIRELRAEVEMLNERLRDCLGEAP